MPVTPLLINNKRLVTYYNARASNWTTDHPCRRVPWLERTLTMGRRFLWIAHHDGVVCATGTGLLARAELAAQMLFAAMDEHVQRRRSPREAWRLRGGGSRATPRADTRCASCWPSSARARTRRPPTRRARGVGSRCA